MAVYAQKYSMAKTPCQAAATSARNRVSCSLGPDRVLYLSLDCAAGCGTPGQTPGVLLTRSRSRALSQPGLRGRLRYARQDTRFLHSMPVPGSGSVSISVGIWVALYGMEFGCFLSDHSKKALVGVVGIGRTSSASESTVEAF